MVVTPLAKMKASSTFRFIFMATVCAAFVNLPAADEKRAQPFVSYEEPVASYLKRIQKGKQQHAFHPAVNVAAWQKSARAALVKLIGLGQMRDELAGFEVKVSQGKHNTVDGVFTRRLCTIETEPGRRVPFYYLVPTGKQRPMALFIAPHGHDKIGLHSYAGAFRNKKHREEILAREGHIAAQAARRGFVAIAPATRGLANEVLVPDPKGGMVACYRNGERYVRHVDTAADPSGAYGDSSKRRVTLIAYLRTAAAAAWSPADGGELRLWPGWTLGQEARAPSRAPPAVDVEPHGGRLAAFASATFHEVRPLLSPPTAPPRCAVTLWVVDGGEQQESEDPSARAAAAFGRRLRAAQPALL